VTDITVTEGQELRLDVSDYFTDAEGDDLYYYAYLNKRNVYLARADQDSDELVITPSYDHAGDYRLFIYANDYNLDGEVLRINLSVTDATPLVTLYNNRAFDVEIGDTRDFTTGLDALARNRGLEILDQAAFAGNTTRQLDVETAHIRGDADISARFVLDADIRQAYFYGDAVFDVVGNGLDNYIVGADGASALYGGDGRDRLYGNGGDDTLYGGNGDDQLYGGDGDDVILTQRGNDQAYGGAGDDIFIFTDGDQQLYIRDFTAGDVVQISGFAGITDFDDLINAATLRDSTGRVIIDIDDDRLMIADLSVASLDADVFNFV
jgi:Ca2+-binding RTX toxin-like protein